MSSGEADSSQQMETKSYLVMKADAEEALELAEEWWDEKEIPKYVHVRGLKREEMSEFVDLYNRAFLASPDPFCPLTEEDAEKMETEGIFVAEMWDSLVGFIACFVEKEKDSIYGEITGLGVAPNRRRRGVATALIRKSSEYFIDAGVEEVYTEIYEENTPSLMLVQAYGFKEVGRREIPTETPPGEPAPAQPGGKIMRRLGLINRQGCEDCRDI